MRSTWDVPTIALLGVGNGAQVALAYAGSHPNKVSRLLLDSPLPLGIAAEARAEQKVKGQQAALDAFVGAVRRVELSRSAPTPRARSTRCLPAPARAPGRAAISVAALTDAIATALAFPRGDFVDSTNALAGTLAAARGGDASQLNDLVNDAETLRETDGQFVNGCSDALNRPTPDRVRELVVEWNKLYPEFGTVGALDLVNCLAWPSGSTPPDPQNLKIPVLLLGVQNDPIVGNEGVAAVAATIINSGAPNRRVMWQGVGHGASIYSTCAMPPVLSYLKTGRFPRPTRTAPPSLSLHGVRCTVRWWRCQTRCLSAFRPRTSPPSAATVLRSVLWPIAIVSIDSSQLRAGAPTDTSPTTSVRCTARSSTSSSASTSTTSTSTRWTRTTCIRRAARCCSRRSATCRSTASRYWFITFNTIAILLAAYFLLRLFKFTLASVAAPALLLAMFCTESVTNTLVFTNINGCILLCEVLFFRWLLDGKVRHQWLAGVAIGLTLVIKPSLAPLLLLPLLNRQWRALVPAIGVPLLFNAVAWPLVSDPMGFVRNTVPYIFSTRDYFNSSIQGNGIYYGLPLWLILVLRIVFGLLAVGSLWLLYRYYRERDPLFWMLTSSGVLLIATFLVLSLGQGYYSMMLFPFLMTVVLPNSVIRNWVAWLAIYGFMTMDRWLLGHWPTHGPVPGVHEDHLRLVADADRGVLRAVLPLPRRQGARVASTTASTRRG